MEIKSLKAKVVKNSRGENTVEICVNGKYKASAPSGASVGAKEVMAIPNSGVPVGFVNRILSKALVGMNLHEFNDLRRIEEIIFGYDKSKDIHKIGGNTVIAIEFALLKALAKNNVWKFLNPLPGAMPMPVGNCIGGGAHYKGNSTDIQEFLLIPDCERFKDAAFANDYVHKKIGKLLKTQKTDEGAWTTTLNADRILNMLDLVSNEAEKTLNVEMSLGVDFAATQLFKHGKYYYRGGIFSREQQIRFVNDLVEKYKLFYVEDPLEENDFAGFKEIKSNLVVGDDLICTNLEYLRFAKDKINSVIVKPNQIGSLIKTKELIDYAKDEDIECILSHRSGETNENIIADLAVAWEIPFIKCGIFGKERKAKINRLIEIEKEMGEVSVTVSVLLELLIS